MFGRNLDPWKMSRMLLIQVAAALLVLSERQNILHEGKPVCSLYLKAIDSVEGRYVSFYYLNF